MRLTLRTLLAYLDDTLEPAQAKLIGQKVSESDAAQELVARIKQVARRRRLTSPPASGPGSKLDPNIIAEYLDNVLPGQQLGDVEETCLSSDVHLAEVAACHQILTLVLGEPALVPPTARRRMYGLIKGREAIRNRKPAAVAVGQGAVEATSTAGDETDETLLLGFSLPRPGSRMRWILPLIAACLLIAAGLAIWAVVSPSLRTISSHNQASDSRPLSVVSGKPKEVVEDAKQPENTGPLEDKNDKLTANQKAKEDAAAQAAKSHPDEKNASAKPKKDSSGAPPSNTDSKAETKKSELTDASNKKPEAPAAAQPPLTTHQPLGNMEAVPTWPGVLLAGSLDATDWRRLKPQSRVSSLELLMSLPGYRSEVRLDSGVSLLLWGNLPQPGGSPIPVYESAVVLYVNPDVDLDFKLARGRVVLTNGKEQGPARIRARFQNEIWDVTLPDKDAVVALESIGLCAPYTKETGGGEPDTEIGLLSLQGQPVVKIRYEQLSLESPSALSWSNRFGRAPAAQKLAKAPDWWTNKKPQGRDALNLETALKGLANRLAIKDALDVVLGETTHDGDPANQVIGLFSLGAMESWSKILDALTDNQQPEPRLIAIGVLRHLLGLNVKNDQRLLQALNAKNYTEPQARTVLQLLHGFTLQDWANVETRTTVAQYLVDDKLAIRQIAYNMLAELVPEGRKIAYDPAGDLDLRERGAAEWKKAVLSVKPPREQRGAKP